MTELLQKTEELFLFNSWIQAEYPSGLAASLSESDFGEVVDTLEVSLGMGICVLT